MKRIDFKHSGTSKFKRALATGIILIALCFGLSAQNSILGKIADTKNNQALPYINVALYLNSDSSLFGGTISDTTGYFCLEKVPEGNYRISISGIGYQSSDRDVMVTGNEKYNLGTVLLDENIIELGEVIALSERLNAKTDNNKTIFYINPKMADVSGNGMDVLKQIPGVSIDLKNNISVQGNRNILVLVDGIERDPAFISQINPSLVDKVEVEQSLLSKYEGNVSAVINIVLKKDRGMSGNLSADIPVTSEMIYSFPVFSMNYGTRKVNLFTSYNGEFSYFNIKEVFNTKTDQNELISLRTIRQKNWSHRFHSGIDYTFNSATKMGLYGSYNPASWEHDGLIGIEVTGEKIMKQEFVKNDEDLNRGLFSSLWFSHTFKNEGIFAVDVQYYNLNAENLSTYVPTDPEKSGYEVLNLVKPRENDMSIKMEYRNIPLGQLNLLAGLKAKWKNMKNLNLPDFNYQDNNFSIYGIAGYNQSLFDIHVGLRMEYSQINQEDKNKNSHISLLPNMVVNFKPAKNNVIQASFVKSIIRPKIYQLNPAITYTDLFMLQTGNAELVPEKRNMLFIEYSLHFKNNYLATRVFYNGYHDVISNLTFIGKNNWPETHVSNLGEIKQAGFQFTGSLKLGQRFTINPFFKVYSNHTAGNKLAHEFNVPDRQQLCYEASLSSLLSLKNDFNISFQYQYASPKNNIQDNWYCDVLYFLSVEKIVGKRFLIGFVNALPAREKFVYTGTEIKGSGFYSKNQGVINLSSFSAWIKLSYRFNRGSRHGQTSRPVEIDDSMQRKGF